MSKLEISSGQTSRTVSSDHISVTFSAPVSIWRLIAGMHVSLYEAQMRLQAICCSWDRHVEVSPDTCEVLQERLCQERHVTSDDERG